MKKHLLFPILFFGISTAKSQNVGIGTSTPNIYAKLEIADSARGILIPRIDSIHRVAIPNTKGLIVYDTTTNGFWYNDGANWLQFAIVPLVEKKFSNALTLTYLNRGF